MEIPEKYRNRLIDNGYFLNVSCYETYGEIVQYGLVGSTTGEYVIEGGLKLKKGDRWKETLDTKKWTVKVEKVTNHN